MAAAEKKEIDFMKEKVTIRLPKDRNNKEDMFVAVNGKTFLIQRGISVEVPLAVAKIIERREKMLDLAMAYEDEIKGKLADMD